MTGPDDALRGALRDLIPDYTGPADPMARVAARVRRRRMRQRTLLTVSSAGVAAVLALAVPALLTGTGGGDGTQAGSPGGAAGPVPTGSGAGGPPAAEPPVHPVAQGRLDGARWAIGSTTLAVGARRCLYSDDALFTRAATCFDQWKGDRAVWAADRWDTGARSVTRVVGVAPRGVAQVRVRFAGGDVEVTRTVSTATDRGSRFFGLVVEGAQTVAGLTPLDAAGSALGPTLTDPGVPPCRAGPYVACAGK